MAPVIPSWWQSPTAPRRLTGGISVMYRGSTAVLVPKEVVQRERERGGGEEGGRGREREPGREGLVGVGEGEGERAVTTILTWIYARDETTDDEHDWMYSKRLQSHGHYYDDIVEQHGILPA